MKRYVLWAIMAAFLAAGPLGCGKKEIEELTAKVTQMQKELATTKEQLAGKTKEAGDLSAKVGQMQAAADAQAAEMAKIKAERDTLKRDLAALKKKKKR
jgi:peptidoglycan hydrolase CwlO-like protein